MLKKLLFLSAIGISGSGNYRPTFIKVVGLQMLKSRRKPTWMPNPHRLDQ